MWFFESQNWFLAEFGTRSYFGLNFDEWRFPCALAETCGFSNHKIGLWLNLELEVILG